MLSARLGHSLDAPLAPIVKRIPVGPNVLTVTGFLMTLAAAVILPYHLRLGGMMILTGGILDMLDGAAARINGKSTKFGAFLDSVLDRYSDAAIFLSIAYYLAAGGNHVGAFLSLGTLVGAFLISYARARSEGLGESCHSGIMERPERIIMLIFATLTGWFNPVLWVMLVLTHLTVIQRVYHVWKALSRQ